MPRVLSIDGLERLAMAPDVDIRVLLQMETPLSPCLVQEPESPGFKCVVMPVKI